MKIYLKNILMILNNILMKFIIKYNTIVPLYCINNIVYETKIRRLHAYYVYNLQIPKNIACDSVLYFVYGYILYHHSNTENSSQDHRRSGAIYKFYNRSLKSLICMQLYIDGSKCIVE